MSTHVITTPTTPSVYQGRWRLDPQRSSVEFHVPNFYGLQTVKGASEATTEPSSSARIPPRS